MSQPQHFVYTIRATRPGFITDMDMTELEMQAMSEHAGYLQELLDAENLVLAGPCLDRAFGVVILEAETEAEARRMMENDPSVVAGVMEGELHAFKLSFARDNLH